MANLFDIMSGWSRSPEQTQDRTIPMPPYEHGIRQTLPDGPLPVGPSLPPSMDPRPSFGYGRRQTLPDGPLPVGPSLPPSMNPRPNFGYGRWIPLMGAPLRNNRPWVEPIPNQILPQMPNYVPPVQPDYIRSPEYYNRETGVYNEGAYHDYLDWLDYQNIIRRPSEILPNGDKL